MKKDKTKWSHKHDFPDGEVWETYNVIARQIVPRLRAFRALDKHGYPEALGSMDEWNKALDKMIYAFEQVMYIPLMPEYRKAFDEGFALFCKYYLYLWD